MIPVQILGKKKDNSFYLKTIRKLKDTNSLKEIVSQLYYDYTVGIEIIYLIMYDFNGNIKSIFQCSQGDVEKVTVNTRSVSSALVLSGVIGGFSMIHNHVSNKPEPSESDFIAEKRIKTIGQIIGIDFYQNFIATEDELIDITRKEII